MKRFRVNLKLCTPDFFVSLGVKSLLAFLFSCFFSFSFAGVYNSISDGDWTDTLTWNPSGIPEAGDTIDIETNVFLDTSITFSATCWMVIKNNGLLSGSNFYFVDGYFENLGIFTFLNADFTGTYVFVNQTGAQCNVLELEFNSDLGDAFNSGLINANQLKIYYGFLENSADVRTSHLYMNGSELDNYGRIETETFFNAGNFENVTDTLIANYIFTYNEFSNYSVVLILDSMKVNNMLTNGSSGRIRAPLIDCVNPYMSIEGEINCNHFIHPEGEINGGGKICISGCAEIGGIVNGSLDICDMSSDSVCDTTYAIIDSANVTFCVDSPCELVGETELENTVYIKLYPHPVSSELTCAFGTVYTGLVVISDMQGRVVFSEIVSEISEIKLDLSYLQAGQYFFRLQNKAFSKSEQLIIR
jgi:hypothetical protein